MTLIVGTDEAGYGPNLGPLVVAATIWEAAVDAAEADSACAAAAAAVAGLWGDSKRIFRGGDGFAALERGTLAGLACCAGGGVPESWAEVLAAVHAGGGDAAEWEPVADGLRVPRESESGGCAALAEGAMRTLAAHGLALVAVRCRIVQPRMFNAALAAGLNKSDLLSQVTLDLAAAAVGSTATAALVWCDRHGGRRRYAPLVSRAFAAPLVQVEEETASHSAYRIAGRSCRIEFTVRGESRLPVALASMTAKYVRERAMEAFNTWWCGLTPGLVPTAGYPVDAARWRRDAAAAVQAAGIPWDNLWRRS